MARGRKRLIAGWGLVGVGVVVCLVLVASRWYSLNRLKSTGGWYASLAWGRVNYGPFLVTNGSITTADLLERNHPPGLHWFVAPEVLGKKTVLDTPILVVERPSGRISAGAPLDIYIQFMLWPLALSAAGLGTGMILWGKRRRSLSHEHCPACGYDMKGLAVGAGCPECGKAIRARSASEGESARV